MEHIIENASHDILKLIKHTFRFNLLDIDEDKQYTIKLITEDNSEAVDCDTLIIESGEETPIIIDGLSICIPEDNSEEISIITNMVNEVDIRWLEQRVCLTLYISSSELTGYSIYSSAYD